MPAWLLLLVQVLGWVKATAPDAVSLVEEIAGLVKGRLPEHADRVDIILGAKGPTADATTQIAADIKAVGG